MCIFFRADETFRAEEGAASVLSSAKDFLLRGLADDNKDLKYVFLINYRQ